MTAPSFRDALGGAETVSRPIEESWIVYACARAKASAVASVPIEIGTGEGKDFVAIKDGPVVSLFKKPNRLTSQAMLLDAGVHSRIEHGEDWWFLLDAQGSPIKPGALPTQIMQVRPKSVFIEKFDSNGMPSIYSVNVYSDGATQKREFPAHSVIPLIDYDPYNLWRGLGAVDAVIREIGVAYQVQRYVEAVAHEGGDPGGFINLPPEASAEQIRQAQAEVDEEFGQLANRGRWKVLAGATFQGNTITPKDMEFPAFMQMYFKAVSAVIGVPLPVVGILDDATYSNMENAMRAMWQGPNGVVAYLRSVEDRINSFFFPSLSDPAMQKMRMRFNLSNVEELQRDMTPRIESAARVASYGVGATFNEALELVGVDKSVKGGDAQVDLDLGGDPTASNDPVTPASDGSQAADGSITGQDVQTQLLNGAQMQTAVDIVAMVVSGEIPRDSGIQLLVTLLGLTPEQAEAIMGSADNPEEQDPQDPQAPQESNEPQPDQDDDDASKTLLGRRMAFTSADERRAYADRVVAKIMLPGERSLRPVARSYLRAYIRSQMIRLRDFVKNGKAARGFDALERISPEDQHVFDVLLLNRREWDAKMKAAFAPTLRKIARSALNDIASDMGTISIGVNDPRVMSHLSNQVLQLTEGVNSTLANKVRAALLETFKDATSIGNLQQAVTEKLPDLEGNLAKVFRDRESRALAIARTEAANATNGARQIQMRADGVTKSEWSTAGDDVVRPDHAKLDGEVRSLDSDFLPNLAYPHDPRAPADQVINCRCVTHPID